MIFVSIIFASLMTASCTAGTGEDDGTPMAGAEKICPVAARTSTNLSNAKNQIPCVNPISARDTRAPGSPLVSINGGTATTTNTSVTLSLSATDATEVYVTNTSRCAGGGTWESFSNSNATKNWTLGQTNSVATVYVKYRDAAGNQSNCVNDTIAHDDIEPGSPVISIDGGAATTTTTSATLTLSATDADEFYVTNTSGCMTGGTWESFASSSGAKSWTLGQTNDIATVYVKYRDAAGNQSACINDAIAHDDIAPGSPVISIDGGAATTTTTSATLTLSATDADEFYVTNASGCTMGGTWESFANANGTKSWTLDQTNTIATVYVKYRDTAGNESACINATITHDNIPPATAFGLTRTTLPGSFLRPEISGVIDETASIQIHRDSDCTDPVSQVESSGDFESPGIILNTDLSENSMTQLYGKAVDSAGNATCSFLVSYGPDYGCGSGCAGNCAMWLFGGADTIYGSQVRTVQKSLDGQNWTNVGTLPLATSYGGSVVFNGKMWVIGGRGNQRNVSSSTDGITWQNQNVLPADLSPFQQIAVFNSKIWMLGGGNISSPDNHAYSSSNGTTWTTSVMASSVYRHVTQELNGFLWLWGGVNGSVLTSAQKFNGTSWTAQSNALPAPLTDSSITTWNGKVWIAGGNSGSGIVSDVRNSADGTSWTRTGALPSVRRSGELLNYKGSLWYIGGLDNAATPNIKDQVLESVDGISWSTTGAIPVPLHASAALVYSPTCGSGHN